MLKLRQGLSVMPDQRSILTHDQYQKAAQQFDYLVTAATGAMCTYILQTFRPKRIDVSPYTLELLALLVLVSSAIVGFKMIEGKVTLLGANAEWLRSHERLGALTSALPNILQSPVVNTETGEVFNAQGLTAEIYRLQARVGSLKADLDRWAARCLSLYRWRNRTLACGFVLLVLARLASPYWQPTPASPNPPHSVSWNLHGMQAAHVGPVSSSVSLAFTMHTLMHSHFAETAV